MKQIECAKLDNCQKIAILLDKELQPFQYLELAERVCSKCQEAEPKEQLWDRPVYEKERATVGKSS